ncbi:MAG: SWIM zinc finger family protein [Chloroflexi bacterium]|nr:SWIM zinc finger family protein [Chloroflexota bacterium]
MGWGWGYYPKPKPRRHADGIKAQSKKFGQTWWASRWLIALERLVDPGRLSRGRSYARSGQVLNIDITTGKVTAQVQGSRPQPYKVKISIKPLSDAQWAGAADAMAAQAIFAAKLLAGEMPNEIEEAFATAKVSLFPLKSDDLITNCSCPDYSNPCKHIAAVYYLLGEQFDGDPFLLFRLRGKSKSEIMDLLRARRSASDTDATPAPAPAKRSRAKKAETIGAIKEPAISLDAEIDRFWVMAADLADWRTTIERPPLDAAPIKRLGKPGFWHGKEDFIAMMTVAYRGVTEAALNAAFKDTSIRTTHSVSTKRDNRPVSNV